MSQFRRAGDKGALPIRADARVLGATLKAGESVTHTVGEGRHAYLVPAVGAITLDGQRFEARDGAALSGGQTVTITAIDDTEIVLVDTAGRLHTKNGLMDELTKIRRVIEKQAPISEVLLVLDATTGQNGVMQAEAFLEHAGVTGLVLTKLDGSAKGGFVLAVQERTGIPVKLLGQGEGIGDLTGFTPHVFAAALVD